MKNAGIWFFLTCKRYLKKGSFLLILLALPLGTFFIRRAEKHEPQEIRIAVCIQGDEREDSLERQLLDNLVKAGEKEGREPFFCFYPCDSEEQVKAEVASRRAECGYSIASGLREKLDEKDYKRCIRVYSAPSTVLASLSTETVFASLMELYGREIFINYMLEQEAVEEAAVSAGADGRQLAAQAGELYDKWMGNGSTFRFQYRQIGAGEALTDEEQLSISIFPVRGLVAVYLFVVGLYSAVMLGFDEEKGLFLPILYRKRGRCRSAVLAAPVFLASLSGLGALASGGCFQGIGKEIGAMGLYFASVCLFSYGVKAVCRKPQAVCCLIPLFLVGSLIFTPVFVDIGQFFPAWGWIEKLFLPSYYLNGF